MPTGSSMARLRDLRNTLLSRMTISSGLADAADAAASSIVSGCDDDMNERYIDFFTPFTALVMAPFLPKPRGHSPEDSSSALSEDLFASLSESARRGAGAPARRTEGAVGAQARRPPWMASRRASRARTGAATPHAAAERACTPIKSARARTRPHTSRVVRASGWRRAQWRTTSSDRPPVGGTVPTDHACVAPIRERSFPDEICRQEARDWRVPRKVFSRFANREIPHIPRFQCHPSRTFPTRERERCIFIVAVSCRDDSQPRRENQPLPRQRRGRWNDPIRVCTPSL